MYRTLAPNLVPTDAAGSVKTTVVCRVAKAVSDLRLVGVYTRELRRQGRRVGFEAN